MGRAERRQAERNKRIEDKKYDPPVTRSQMNDKMNKVRDEMSRIDTENLMTCFALVLMQNFNFTSDQVIECLSGIDEYMGYINDGTATMDDIKSVLEEDYGVIIKMQD